MSLGRLPAGFALLKGSLGEGPPKINMAFRKFAFGND